MLLRAGAIDQQTFDRALAEGAQIRLRAAIDDALATETLLGGAQAMFLEYAHHATNAAEVAQEAVGNAIFALEDSLVSFITTGKFEIKDFFQTLRDEVARAAVRMAIFGPLFRFLGGVATPGLAGLMVDPFPEITGRASGGPLRRGQASIVGEHGRELFVPSTAGQIVPHGALGVVVVFNMGDVIVNVPDDVNARDPHQAARIGAEVGRAVKAPGV